METYQFDILLNIFATLSLLIIPIGIRYLYSWHIQRVMTYKNILIDSVFIIFAWGSIPFFGILFDRVSSEFATYISFLILILLFLFPIITIFIYFFIYKKYFYQRTFYFAFEIFICYGIVPLLLMVLMTIIFAYRGT